MDFGNLAKKERDRQYYQNHKEQSKERVKKWREDHRDHCKEYFRKYNQDHREQIREQRKEYQRKYRQKHRERIRKYNNKYRRELLRKRKEKYVHMLGDKCVKCGYDKCLSALDFHHLDNSKENDDESKTKAFEQKIKDGKIQLLCSNCHRELHHSTELVIK